MKYKIYHSYPDLNFSCKPEKFMYKLVGGVEVSSLEEAFKLSQNDFGTWAEYEVRSTSVGDIIQYAKYGELPKCYIVMSQGFKEVPEHWLYYIDWPLIESMKHALEQVGDIVNRVTGIKGMAAEPPQIPHEEERARRMFWNEQRGGDLV